MTGGMRNRAGKTRKEIDQRIAAIESNLVADTKLDWELIRSELTDQAEYEGLMKIVNESTKRNENLGQLVERVKGLSTESAELLCKITKFLGR